jgi:hypothetical protein
MRSATGAATSKQPQPASARVTKAGIAVATSAVKRALFCESSQNKATHFPLAGNLRGALPVTPSPSFYSGVCRRKPAQATANQRKQPQTSAKNRKKPQKTAKSPL